MGTFRNARDAKRFSLTEPEYNQGGRRKATSIPKLDGVTKSYIQCLGTWTRRTGLAPEIGRRRSQCFEAVAWDHCGLVLCGLRYR